MLNHLKKKTKFVLIAIVSGIAPLSSGFAATTEDAYLEEAKGIVGKFFSSLKAELETALNQGGPTNAVRVCKERAPAIAAEYSAETGWDVGRTSLKLRNPSNAPDDWEKQVLLGFEERRAKGEDVETMSFAETTQVNGEKQFRFMKAIPTGGACLLCHGADLPPDLVEVLDEAYPEDQARGFSLGDIRGAFTLSKPLSGKL